MSTQLQSRYIHINDYCLVEYIYAFNGQPVTTAEFNLIENNNIGAHQIFNTNGYIQNTANIQDHTAVQIAANKFVYIDQDKIPNYLDYDTNLVTSSIYTGMFVYDTVRFHFVTGFNFAEFAAIILTVKHLENVGNKTNIFCNILASLDTIDTLITYNTKPIFLGDTHYDRYIDVRIPAIKKLNTDYFNATGLAREATLAAKMTPVHLDTGDTSSGFIVDNPISFSIDEITRIDKLKTNATTYDLYIGDKHYEAALPQINEFELVGATIQEATDGDYIEYYATYNDGHIAEFIGQLNAKSPHDKWVIAHQLSIYEQVGSEFINSDTALFYQSDNFDTIRTFRPILKYAGSAISYSIDYMMRLVNQRNGDQILRTASFSSYDCAKYGKHMSKISLLSDPQSHKIYNRIFKGRDEATELFMDPNLNTPIIGNSGQTSGVLTKYVYVPTFFNFNRLSVSQKNMSVSTNDPTTDIIYKQGDMHIVLYQFTNILKFKVYDVNNSNNAVPMNLSFNSQYFIVFTNSGRKTRFSNVNDSSMENFTTGEIVFNIAQDDSELILKSNTRDFYITTVGSDNTETVLYTGFWNNVNEKDLIDQNIAKVKEAYSTDQKTQTTLDRLQQNAIDQAAAQTPTQPMHIPGYVGSVNYNEKSNVLKVTPLSEKK